MSILIKGMNMPKNCRQCNFTHCTRFGQKLCTFLNEATSIKHKLPDCPLVEIPTPHGRLIDADRLIAVLKSTTAISQSDYDLFNHIVGLIEHQPTVIEKE